VELERVTVAIRERTPSEALDLGFALARWHLPTFLLCLASLALPAAGLAGLLASRIPAAALLVFWWLKPLFDRPVLFVASRALLGQRLRLPEDLAELARLLFRALPGDLTFRRFSPWRSYTLPVRLLEGLGGAPLRRRLVQIGAAGRLTALGLTVSTLVFQLGLWFGLVMFVQLFHLRGEAPAGAWQAYFASFGSPVGYWCFVASVIVIESYYVCAGFCLYVNRRVGLEGWDLELVLRRLARRLAQAASPVAGLFLLLLLTVTPGHAQAETRLEEPTPERIAREVSQVLQEPEFRVWRDRTVWRPVWGKRLGRRSEEQGWAWNRLSGLASWIARLAPWLLGLAASAAIAYLLAARLRTGQRSPRAPPQGGPALPGASGPDVERLPEAWAAAARAAWSAGRPDQAFSLLYRGALALLEARQGQPLSCGATEGEALARARMGPGGPAEPILLALLEQSAGAWLELAYGRRVPSAERFAAVLALAGRASGVARA
jgi:hypothetical protein